MRAVVQQHNITYPKVSHVYRNLDAIRELAEERILTDFDTTRQVEDSLRKGIPFKATKGKVYLIRCVMRSTINLIAI
jgi:hypothetical protein